MSLFHSDCAAAVCMLSVLLQLILLFLIPSSVTPGILKAMSERQFEFTSFKRVRVATGTWNVNGGKQFRSNILGTSELTDWLLDSPKLSGVSEFQGKTSQSKSVRNICWHL